MLVNAYQHSSKGPLAPKERRRAKRSALRMRANVTLPDISLNGLSCRVPYALDTGQSCTIELDLKKFGSSYVELQTVVRSCRPVPDGKFEAGLEFLNTPENIMEILQTLLR
jgi:hypothetical protein